MYSFCIVHISWACFSLITPSSTSTAFTLWEICAEAAKEWKRRESKDLVRDESTPHWFPVRSENTKNHPHGRNQKLCKGLIIPGYTFFYFTETKIGRKLSWTFFLTFLFPLYENWECETSRSIDNDGMENQKGFISSVMVLLVGLMVPLPTVMM